MSGQMSPAAARDLIGTETGVSQWHTISQEQVNQFADTTGDHGYLTLSMLSMLGAEANNVRLQNTRITINYGLDKVRFLNPVRVGSRIRARFVLMSIEEKNPGQWLLKNQATVEIDGQQKPAMIAESLALVITG